MKYVYMNDLGTAHEIIPEFVDTFPGIPVTERYSMEFLDQCLAVDDAVEVQINDIYFPAENVFTAPTIEAISTRYHQGTIGNIELARYVSLGCITAEQANSLKMEKSGGGG